MIALVIVLTVCLAVVSYIAVIQYKKYNQAAIYCEAYVRLVGQVYFNVKETVDTMNEIDASGAFAADDSVGHTFTALKDVQDDLYQFITKYVNTEDGGAEEDTEEEGA